MKINGQHIKLDAKLPSRINDHVNFRIIEYIRLMFREYIDRWLSASDDIGVYMINNMYIIKVIQKHFVEFSLILPQTVSLPHFGATLF